VHLIEQIGGDLTGKAIALRRTIQTGRVGSRRGPGFE
jgi:hypothetical protein